MHKYIIKFYDFYLILSGKNNNKLSFKNERGKFFPLLLQRSAQFYEYFICARCICRCNFYCCCWLCHCCYCSCSCNLQLATGNTRAKGQAPHASAKQFVIFCHSNGSRRRWSMLWIMMRIYAWHCRNVADSAGQSDSRWMNGWMGGWMDKHLRPFPGLARFGSVRRR